MHKKKRQENAETWLVRTSDKLAQLPLMLVPYRKLILSLLLVGVFISALGASRFKLKESMEAFFSQHDPRYKEYQWFKFLFGSDDVLLIMYEPEAEELFSSQAMRDLQKVEAELNSARTDSKSALSHISRIRSIISADYLEVQQDQLLSRPFIGSELPKDAADWSLVRRLAKEHPDYESSLFSKNEKKLMLMIETDFGARVLSKGMAFAKKTEHSSDEFDFGIADINTGQTVTIDEVPSLEEVEMTEFSAFMAEVRGVLKKYKWKEQDNIYMAGNPWIMDFFQTVILQELGMYFALSIFIIWIVLYASFRSVSALVWPTVLLVLTMVILMGLIGWSGVEMTFMINIIVFLLLAICIASSIHIMSSYQICLAEGKSTSRAIQDAFKRSGTPIVLAALTTALGLVSVLFVPILALQNFGIFASLGVLITLLLNLSLWPIFLSIWAPKLNNSASKPPYLWRFLSTQYVRIEQNRGMIFSIFAGLCVFFSLGIPHVYIDTNISQMIKPGYGVKESYESIDAHFGGTSSVEILLNTGEQDGIKSHKVLGLMDGFNEQLRKEYPQMLAGIRSIVNPTKLAYKNLSQGDQNFYKVPESNRILAQTLFSFESADSQSRRLMVDDNWQVARISLRMKSHGTHEYEAFMNDLIERADQHFAPLKKKFPNFMIHYTGSVPLMMHLVSLVSISQIRSFGLALAVITIILFFLFGSIKFGVLAMIPNIFPLVVVMGFAGWFRIPMDSDTLLVMPIAIGIAVDDTIHFLSHYKTLLLQGFDTESAIRDTFKKVGPAIVNTSLVLSCGFLIFIFSAHKPLNNFGILSAIAIFTALLADLFLLPLLLRFLDFSKPVKIKTHWSRSISTALFFLGFSSLIMAELCKAESSLPVREIVKKVLNRNEGYSRYAKTSLISCSFTVDKDGKRSCSSGLRRKALETISRDFEVPKSLSRSMSVLIEPKIEAGLAFLQEDLKDNEADSRQWLFLPDLKGKVKRVDGSRDNRPKTGTLFGSELAYEDLEKHHIDDYTYKLLEESSYQDKPVWIIESLPLAKKSLSISYGKSKQWIDKEHFISLKSELYDKQGYLAKTLYNQGLKEVDKKRAKGVWIGTKLIVVNHKIQRMSMMKIEHVKLNIEIPNDFPSIRALQEEGYREAILTPIRQEKNI